MQNGNLFLNEKLPVLIHGHISRMKIPEGEKMVICVYNMVPKSFLTQNITISMLYKNGI